MEQSATIAAIATPRAEGGLSCIRISGSNAIEIADKIFQTAAGSPLGEKLGYTAAYGKVLSLIVNALGEREVIDDAVALVFRAPHSYTGEDVVEITCHGGLYMTDRVLRAVLDAGARPAGPGEFTKRAFLNGKLTLTQAEAVRDIIAANGAEAARAARVVFDGALFQRISGLKQSLLSLCGELAAWVDYPEEDIPAVDPLAMQDTLFGVKDSLQHLLDNYDTGRLIREGITTAIVGRPNVGKSTLMNLLAGSEKSIVTEIAGTTRDVVEETVRLGNAVLRLQDTAGIRESDDLVEQVGVERARASLSRADLVLAVFDSSQSLENEDIRLIDELNERPVVAVINKSDLPQKIDVKYILDRIQHVVMISAKQTENLTSLETAIDDVLQLNRVDGNTLLLANERQRNCVIQALHAITDALDAVQKGVTLDAVTVSVEEAVDALLALTGERITDAVVDEVFSHFCVGK